MEFRLQFNMDNAVFSKVREDEIMRILEEIIDQLLCCGESSRIFDLNGNEIGKWEITTD